MENGLSRAKRQDNNEWVYGYHVKKLGTYGEEKHMIFEPESDSFIEVNPSTICQCTGWPDKDQKLISEYDIVSITTYLFGEPENEYRGIIRYSEACMAYCLDTGKLTPISQLTEICTVVYRVDGNVFDNPELLEGLRSRYKKEKCS